MLSMVPHVVPPVNGKKALPNWIVTPSLVDSPDMYYVLIEDDEDTVYKNISLDVTL